MCIYSIYIYIELCVYMHMYTHVYLDIQYVQSPNTSKPHMHRSYRGGLRSGQLVVIVEVLHGDAIGEHQAVPWRLHGPRLKVKT